MWLLIYITLNPVTHEQMVMRVRSFPTYAMCDYFRVLMQNDNPFGQFMCYAF